MGSEFSNAPAQHCAHRRRGSIYVAVLGVAIVLTLIGIMSVTLVRIDRRSAELNADLTEATLLAQSASEHAITLITADSSWRTNYTHDVWEAPIALGSGSFRWKLVADSANLQSPAGGAVKIVGEGSVNESLQQYSVYVSGGFETSPAELRGYDSTTSIAEEAITTTRFWAQYFKPALPADATGWRVTSVEIRCRQDGTALANIHARLYEPLPSHLPSTTMLDNVTENEWNLPAAIDWHTFTFTGNYSHDPDEGMCLAFESTFAVVAMAFEYQTESVSEADSGFIDGDPTWQSVDTSQAMLYKIHGTYTTATKCVAGTWTIE